MSNNKQSSVEQLMWELWDTPKDKFTWYTIMKYYNERHKQEIYQHAINFYLFCENDEVTDQKVEIIENLYKDYLKQFYNETFKSE